MAKKTSKLTTDFQANSLCSELRATQDRFSEVFPTYNFSDPDKNHTQEPT